MPNTFIKSAAIAALLTLFATAAPAFAQEDDEPARWRDVATERDRARIRGWRRAWVEALGEARQRNSAEVSAQGALFEPDAGLAPPALPPGNYRCRTIKLGSQGARNLNYVAYPWFTCRVARDGDTLSFRRLGGSQRPVGHIHAAGPRRMIFLGSLQLGDERRVLRYGADADRNLAGIVERVGEQRWRLVFPRPTFESILDVIELVPAA